MAEREKNSETPQSSMRGEVVFESMTNNGLKCADCRFKIPDGGVLQCHKFDRKPIEVINGGDCAKYKPE